MRFFALILVVAAVMVVPAAAEPAMWHVADADTDITIFGTIHALPAGNPWLSPRIGARIDAADTIVLETVVPDASVLAPLVTQLGMRSGLPPLSTRIAPSKRAALAAAEKSLGLPPARLDAMKTWLAAIALGDGAVAQLGLTPADGVETTLTTRAATAKKTVIGLETPESQLRLFDNLSETDARALLDSTVDDIATARDDTNALVAYWQAGETEQLAADFDKAFKATPGLQKALLTTRNAAWAAWIAARLAVPGKVFVAVGAGHLGGPDSVVAMLKAKGLTVERLP